MYLLKLHARKFCVPSRYTAKKVMGFLIHQFQRLSVSTYEGRDLVPPFVYVKNSHHTIPHNLDMSGFDEWKKCVAGPTDCP